MARIRPQHSDSYMLGEGGAEEKEEEEEKEVRGGALIGTTLVREDFKETGARIEERTDWRLLFALSAAASLSTSSKFFSLSNRSVIGLTAEDEASEATAPP